MASERWQDWDDLLLGLWVFLSPWVFGFAEEGGAPAWTAWILGGGIALVAAIALPLPGAWEELLNAALGVCLILAPWVLGFSDLLTATVSCFVAGLLVSVLALWALAGDRTQHGGRRGPGRAA